MEDNDLHATYTTTISFDHTKFNYTIPVEDNQVAGNQDKVVISGKISNARNCSVIAKSPIFCVHFDTLFDSGTIIGISVGGIVGLVFTIFSMVMVRIKMRAKEESIITKDSKR